MSLDGAIDGLRTVLSAMSGLSRTYADPPDSISQFPALIVYAREGEMSVASAGFGRSIHTLWADVVIGLQVMPLAIDSAKPYPDRAFALLRANQTLSGAVEHIIWPIRHRIIPVQYNNTVHLVCRIEVKVKINETW